jgi:hypothetical protein
LPRRGWSSVIDQRRGLASAISVRMFNLLLSDCSCPRVLSFLPDRVTGLLKIRISEHPYSYCDQLGALLGFPENRSPAFWTKVECHSSTAICSTRVSFGDALSEPDLLSRIECLNTESASRPALAFEAMAHGDADGVASNCYLELSATACGFAIRHVDYLSTETSKPSVRERSFLHLKTPDASSPAIAAEIKISARRRRARAVPADFPH